MMLKEMSTRGRDVFFYVLILDKLSLHFLNSVVHKRGNRDNFELPQREFQINKRIDDFLIRVCAIWLFP